MTQHTPGPWHVYSRSIGSDRYYNRATLAHGTNPEGDGPKTLLAEVGGMSVEDLRLIEAAPEMLEVLKLFMAQYNACGPNSNFGRIFANVGTAAAQAISKAEGL